MNNVKRAICLLIGLCTIFFASTNCSALVPRSELALGKVTIDENMNDVKKIYGEPVRSVAGSTFGSGKAREYTHYYGDGSFSVIVSRYNEQEKVLGVKTVSNSKIATPSGIKVGMTKNQLISVYGPPDYIERKDFGIIVFKYTDYKPARGEPSPALNFVMSNATIITITLSSYY